MSKNNVYSELKELRKLQRRGKKNALICKYKSLFERLSPFQCKVMIECYIAGLSYKACGKKVYYSEIQIKRIVKQSIKRLVEWTNS